MLCFLLILMVAGSALAQEALPETVSASTPQTQQMELATSAAPPAISGHATVYILGKTGMVKVREGTNGFTCLVERETPETLEPECFDLETSGTLLKPALRIEELRAQGKREQGIKDEIEAGYRSGKYRAPRKAGIIYMMSSHNRVLDPESGKIISFPGHLMFPAPYIAYKDLGDASGKETPYIVHPGKPDALIIVIPRSH